MGNHKQEFAIIPNSIRLLVSELGIIEPEGEGGREVE